MKNFQKETYWNERFKKEYSLRGVGDISFDVNFNNILYQIRSFVFKLILKKLKLENKDIKILDIGSGTGFYVKHWLELGYKNVVSSDISDVAVENLKKNFSSIKVIKFDITEKKLPFDQSERFDVISVIDVLFHIVDENEYINAIQNISKLLKPGGYLIASENFLTRKVHFQTKHQAFRSKEKILKVFEDNLLFPVLSKPMFVILYDPINGNKWNFFIWHQIKRIYRFKMYFLLKYCVSKFALVILFQI